MERGLSEAIHKYIYLPYSHLTKHMYSTYPIPCLSPTTKIDFQVRRNFATTIPALPPRLPTRQPWGTEQNRIEERQRRQANQNRGDRNGKSSQTERQKTLRTAMPNAPHLSPPSPSPHRGASLSSQQHPPRSPPPLRRPSHCYYYSGTAARALRDSRAA